MEDSSEPIQNVDTVLFWSWSTVYQPGPTLSQHWMNASCLLGCSIHFLSSGSIINLFATTANIKLLYYIYMYVISSVLPASIFLCIMQKIKIRDTNQLFQIYCYTLVLTQINVSLKLIHCLLRLSNITPTLGLNVSCIYSPHFARHVSLDWLPATSQQSTHDVTQSWVGP